MSKYQSFHFPVTGKWSSLIRTKVLMVSDYFSVSGVLVTEESKVNGAKKDKKKANYQQLPKAMIAISIIHQLYAF